MFIYKEYSVCYTAPLVASNVIWVDIFIDKKLRVMWKHFTARIKCSLLSVFSIV